MSAIREHAWKAYREAYRGGKLTCGWEDYLRTSCINDTNFACQIAGLEMSMQMKECIRLRL